MSYDCVCDYDPPSFYHQEIRKARKAHKCDECTGMIAPGEKYEHVRGKWEGYVDTFNTCEACVDIRTWVKNSVPCLCWAHGNMLEGLREAVEEAHYRAPAETVGLRFGLLRRIAMRDKAKKAGRAKTLGQVHQ
jgi:RNase P subunit RPR2